MIHVKHSHGLTEKFPDVDSALESLRSIYGNEIVVAGIEDISSGRALVWSTEEAAMDDDGVRAVASIKEHRRVPTEIVYVARPRADAAWPQALHHADFRREHVTVSEPPYSHWEHVRTVLVTLPVGWRVAMSNGGDEQLFDERGRRQTLAVVAGCIVVESMDHENVILGSA